MSKTFSDFKNVSLISDIYVKSIKQGNTGGVTLLRARFRKMSQHKMIMFGYNPDIKHLGNRNICFQVMADNKIIVTILLSTNKFRIKR